MLNSLFTWQFYLCSLCAQAVDDESLVAYYVSWKFKFTEEQNFSVFKVVRAYSFEDYPRS